MVSILVPFYLFFDVFHNRVVDRDDCVLVAVMRFCRDVQQMAYGFVPVAVSFLVTFLYPPLKLFDLFFMCGYQRLRGSFPDPDGISGCIVFVFGAVIEFVFAPGQDVLYIFGYGLHGLSPLFLVVHTPYMLHRTSSCNRPYSLSFRLRSSFCSSFVSFRCSEVSSSFVILLLRLSISGFNVIMVICSCLLLFLKL